MMLCAWLIWSVIELSGSQRILVQTPHEAFDTLDQCEAARARHHAVHKKLTGQERMHGDRLECRPLTIQKPARR